ncbi:MAG: 2-hydroxyacid dehydrogenase [Candidatus Goldbacteria bacterium]|nr:2-hydroxyacid dehydrogenase [Candidatus Goldiibacteriota bacterium]
MKKIKVAFFDAKPYDIVNFDHVNKKYGYTIKYLPPHLNKETAFMAGTADVVCAFVNDTIDAPVIAELKKQGVKLIALRCAGYNNVDLKASFNTLHVARVPAYSPNAVAEHAAALMMTLNRKVHKAYFRTRDGNFSINGLLGFDMKGKTAGVIGTGKIGREMINILKGFGVKVVAYDSFPDKKYAAENKIEYASLDKIYKEADITTLHCPLNKDTFHMINTQSIKKMKKGVMIINTGRGSLIDAKALISGLKSGRIGYAGLDVYEEEDKYFFEDFSGRVLSDDVLARLLTFPNVIITSHQAFFTKEAVENIADTTLGNIKEYFEKHTLTNEICYQCNKTCVKKKNNICF